MQRLLGAVTGAVLIAAIATGVVFALNYEGEDFCQDSPAWPNGTYLGQMHPYHSDFYRAYAELRGWDPCTTWADDQRTSAVRGLSELGYRVSEPIDPTLAHARQLVRQALITIAESSDDTEQFLWITDRAFSRLVHITFGTPTREQAFAQYQTLPHRIVIADRFRGERPEALATLLAHEFVHAATPHSGTHSAEDCYGEERFAFQIAAWVWWALGPLLEQSELEQGFFTRDDVGEPSFEEWLQGQYADSCGQLP